MAGSYGQIVQKDGNLASNRRVAEMLENDDDVFETVEEMYGMIWFLVGNNPQWAGREKAMIHEARRDYRQGLKVAKEVNGS
jgi:hypothetical protein